MERNLHPGARNVTPASRRTPATVSRSQVVVPHRQTPHINEMVEKPVASRPTSTQLSTQAHETAKPTITQYKARPHHEPKATKVLHDARTDSTFFEIKPSPKLLRRPTAPRTEPVVNQTPELTVQPIASTQADAPKKTKRAHRRRSFRFRNPHILQGMAAFLFVFGMYVAIDGWLVNRAASEQAQVLSSRAVDGDSSSDDEVLDEKKPTDPSSYKVAPDLPRTLEIPSIGVSTRVLQLGVKSDNSLAAPSNIHDVGWYTGSAKPTATAGAMLMDGHVSGPTKNGVFYDLKKLKVGDDIVVERGNGQRQTFAVSRVKTVQVESVDMGELMRSDDQSKLGLNLITCGGLFDARTNTFRSRVLVFAVQK